MSSITLLISGGSPPYNISVKKTGDNVERYVSYNGSTLTFTSDPSSEIYDIKIVDSEICEYNSTFSLNCTPYSPSFIYRIENPYCTEENGSSFSQALVALNGVINATRYIVCYDTTVFNCSNCNISDGNTSGTMGIFLNTPTQPNVTVNFVIRLYNGDTCNYYTDIVGSFTTPECTSPCQLSLSLGAPNC